MRARTNGDVITMIKKLAFFRSRKKNKTYKQFPELNTKIIDHFYDNYGYTMPLSLLVKLKKICTTIKPKLVVEFGSGVSTIVISKAIVEYGGFLITFDESTEWINNTYKMIEEKINIAYICIPNERERIDHEALEKYISLNIKPDLVVIDGPSGGPRFSNSAMRIYDKLLSSQCICCIDDTDRAENDNGAIQIKTKFSLLKQDYNDPVYVNHKYSILYPANIQEI